MLRMTHYERRKLADPTSNKRDTSKPDSRRMDTLLQTLLVHMLPWVGCLRPTTNDRAYSRHSNFFNCCLHYHGKAHPVNFWR